LSAALPLLLYSLCLGSLQTDSGKKDNIKDIVSLFTPRVCGPIKRKLFKKERKKERKKELLNGNRKS
jgi:hypothetical protein